jgi:hypothetical protein
MMSASVAGGDPDVALQGSAALQVEAARLDLVGFEAAGRHGDGFLAYHLELVPEGVVGASLA